MFHLGCGILVLPLAGGLYVVALPLLSSGGNDGQ